MFFYNMSAVLFNVPLKMLRFVKARKQNAEPLV